jgi:hypothetical protein
VDFHVGFVEIDDVVHVDAYDVAGKAIFVEFVDDVRVDFLVSFVEIDDAVHDMDAYVAIFVEIVGVEVAVSFF